MANFKNDLPWYIEPHPLPARSHIVIIGGGVAGVLTAYHLQKTGYEITLIEGNSSVMSGASGNPVAILDPFLSASSTLEGEFYRLAYLYALKFYKSLGKKIFEECGLIKKPKDENDRLRFKRISEKYGKAFTEYSDGQLIFSKSGYVRPQALSSIICNRVNILHNKKVDRIKQVKDKKWSLFESDGNHIIDAAAIIVCNACGVDGFHQTNHINLDKIYGQLSYLSPSYTDKSVLCRNGYVTPIVQTDIGKANICGATFEKDANIELSNDSHRENLGKCPVNLSNMSVIGGRKSIRAMSPDHMPICGPAPNYKQYLVDYTGLRHGPNHRNFPTATYHDNLFINVGLGSRGFLTAPLLAKFLASQISGNRLPKNRNLFSAIHPARFIIRKLSKK